MIITLAKRTDAHLFNVGAFVHVDLDRLMNMYHNYCT